MSEYKKCTEYTHIIAVQRLFRRYRRKTRRQVDIVTC